MEFGYEHLKTYPGSAPLIDAGNNLFLIIKQQNSLLPLLKICGEGEEDRSEGH